MVIGQGIGQLHHAFPHRNQPGPRLCGLAPKVHQALGGLDGQLWHVALELLQLQPGLLQLGRVVCTVDELDGQATHDALRSVGRESTVLAQQARRVQCILRLPCQAGGLELDAQCQGAPGGAMRQSGKSFEGRAGVSVVQRPARTTHLHAFTKFLLVGGATGRGQAQGQLQLAFACGAVLQRVGTLGRHHVRQRPQVVTMGHFFVGSGECFFFDEGGQRRLA